MSSILSIEIAKKRSTKHLLKVWLGKSLAVLSPERSKQLWQEPTSQPRGLRDKAIMAFLKDQALLENQQEFFERLHLDFWQGEGGSVFSDNCDHRFEDLFLAKQKVDYEVLRNLCIERRPSELAEFGCNSGLLLNYLTRNLPNIGKATGIEINREQVQRNQNSSRFDNRIQFSCSEGGDWLLAHGRPNSVFVTNGGVLEYFRRERLDQMLQHISLNLAPAIFFSVEPVALDHDWSKTTESVPFGDELSFSHNYFDLFNSNGFEIQHQRYVDFEAWRMMTTIAVCN